MHVYAMLGRGAGGDNPQERVGEVVLDEGGHGPAHYQGQLWLIPSTRSGIFRRMLGSRNIAG